MVYNLTESAQEFLSENRPIKSDIHSQSLGNEEVLLEESLADSACGSFLEARIQVLIYLSVFS